MEFHDLLAEAESLPFSENWKKKSIVQKVMMQATLQGIDPIKVLAGYFQKTSSITHPHWVCPKCHKVFKSQAALQGHGSSRCKG